MVITFLRRVADGFSPITIPDGDDPLFRIKSANIQNKLIETSCLLEALQIKFKPIAIPAAMAGFCQLLSNNSNIPIWVKPDGSTIDLSAGEETTGTATGAANGSATQFTIAHGLGSIPFTAFVQVSSVLGSTIDFSYTYDSTNITVTFASAPSAGTITFQWKAVK